MRIKTFRAGAAALALSLLALSACGGDSQQPTKPGEPFAGMTSQYVAADGPADLAGQSSVVIRGSTATPQEGRIWGESRDDWGATTTLVVPIAVDAVEAGKLEPATGDLLYLEMEAPVEQAGRDDRERFAEAMTDREGMFFLQPAPTKASRYVGIVNPDAGRPAGQPIYQASSPEGILISKQDGNGVWSVGLGRDFPDSSLEDFLPNMTKFPHGLDSDRGDPPIEGTPTP